MQLVIVRSSAVKIEAQINWQWEALSKAGSVFRAAVADRRLGIELIACFLDALVSQTPFPVKANRPGPLKGLPFEVSLKERAAERQWFSCRRLNFSLKRDSWEVNWGKLYQLCCEKELTSCIRGGRKRAFVTRGP